MVLPLKFSLLYTFSVG